MYRGGGRAIRQCMLACYLSSLYLPPIITLSATSKTMPVRSSTVYSLLSVYDVFYSGVMTSILNCLLIYIRTHPHICT